MIAVLPEPEPYVPEPDEPPEKHPPPPKPLYRDVAAARGLPVTCALLGVVAAGLIGYRYGLSWALVPLLPLVPAGVAIGVVDAMTRTIPVRLMYPTYALVALTCVVAALGAGEPARLIGSLIGLVVWFGFFFVLWFVYPPGMGYGDVRLAGAIGIVVGLLGFGVAFVAFVAAALIGGVGSLALTALRMTDRYHVPYGPFLLLGTLVGSLVA